MDISSFVEQQADKPEIKEVTPEAKPEESKPENKTPNPTPSEAPKPAQTISTPLGQPEAQPDASGIVDNILGSIGDLGTGDYLKLCVFGEPGTTKSSFAATAEKCLILDCEKGTISAKFSPHGIGAGTQKVPWQGWEAFIQLIKMLKEGHPSLDKFETFAIDTFSDVHKRGLAMVCERDWKRAPSKYNQFVAETEQHTENNEKLLRIIRVLRDLDRNLILLTHAKTVEPKGKPAKTYGDFSESLFNRISAMMDASGHIVMTEIDKVPTPVFRFVNNGTVQSKNRFNLPSEVANPTFPQILNIWEKAKTE